MKQNNSVKGYIIEASKNGYFYHRLGYWVQYSSSAEGYVWSEDETNSILNANEKGHWELEVARLHPAIYDGNTGVTVLTDPPVAFKTVFQETASVVEVPINEGKILDIDKSIASILGSTVSFTGSGMSL